MDRIQRSFMFTSRKNSYAVRLSNSSYPAIMGFLKDHRLLDGIVKLHMNIEGTSA